MSEILRVNLNSEYQMVRAMINIETDCTHSETNRPQIHYHQMGRIWDGKLEKTDMAPSNERHNKIRLIG